MKFSLNKLDNGGYSKVEHYNTENVERLAENYRDVLGLLGENPNREGLEKTPIRVA